MFQETEMVGSGVNVDRGCAAIELGYRWTWLHCAHVFRSFPDSISCHFLGVHGLAVHSLWVVCTYSCTLAAGRRAHSYVCVVYELCAVKIARSCVMCELNAMGFATLQL